MSRKNNHDAALDAFIADVARTADLQTAIPPRPDFGEALRRAHVLDPSAAIETMIDEAAELATVVRLTSQRQLTQPPADPPFDDFIGDVRAHNEAIADNRQLAGIPAQVLHAPPSRKPQIASALTIAAALALFILVGSPRLGISLQGPSNAHQAMMQGTLERSYKVLDGTRESETMADDSDSDQLSIGRHAPRTVSLESESTEHPAKSALAAATTPASETASANSYTLPVGPERVRRPKASADELAALDKAAQEAWRRGEFETAAKNFRALIRRDRGGRWTQLAYGDLFTLTRQRGNSRAELSLWREYLRKHAMGPHADDAHAGICRRTAAKKRPACWKKYLKARPNGAYRQQAELAQNRGQNPGEAL